uniref:Uncharacterized protein n=1 Tax=Rhizophora mucronata TaxID=61149 RepID=A0A2P2PBJ2_RHIMU
MAKMECATGVLSNHRILIKLKGKIHSIMIRPSILYSSECLADNKHVKK